MCVIDAVIKSCMCTFHVLSQSTLKMILIALSLLVCVCVYAKRKILVKILMVIFLWKMSNPSEYFFSYYKLPGPWYNVKYFVYYWFFTVVKSILRVFGIYTKYGKPEDNDGPHQLNDVIGYDATWIGGTTSDSKWIVFAIDRRKDWKMSIGHVYLEIPGIGRLITPTYPHSVENALGNSKNGFAFDEFSLEMNKPLRWWNVKFQGKMTFLDDPNDCIRTVKIMAEWTSENDVWLLNRDWNSDSFADSFALENCSKFFASIFDRSKNDVVHWEQFGRLNANVEIDGKQIEFRNAITLRDRSFGKIRDFSEIHRYFYVIAFLENGRSLMITIVCHKKTFSRMFFGFISNDDGTNSDVNWSDLNIHQFGENGRVADELCFLIKIDKVIHTVQMVCHSQHWYRLENGIVRCDQIGECLLDDQHGKCLIQSLYNEASLSVKTLGKPLTFLDD